MHAFPTSFAWPRFAFFRCAVEDRRERQIIRRTVLARSTFEFSMALAAVVAVPIVIFSPGGIHASAVGALTRSWAPMWLTLYGAAGLFIVVGLFCLLPRAEVIGLVLFVAALITDGVAVLLRTGGGGAAAALTFIALGFASGLRARLVWGIVMAAHRTGEYER